MEKKNKLWNNIFEKLKNIKKDQLLILFLVGVLLLIIALPTKEVDSNSKIAKQDVKITKVDTKEGIAQETKEEEFILQLENKLKKILERMEGVGEVEVMISTKDNGKTIVEKDIPRTNSTTQETDSAGGNRSSTDIQTSETTVYSQLEDGSQIPYVINELKPQMEGIVVVAQGGGNGVVAKNISDAVLALFSIEVHKIKVVKMIE